MVGEQEAQGQQKLQGGAGKPNGNGVIFVHTRKWRHWAKNFNLNGKLFWRSLGGN